MHFMKRVNFYSCRRYPNTRTFCLRPFPPALFESKLPVLSPREERDYNTMMDKIIANVERCDFPFHIEHTADELLAPRSLSNIRQTLENAGFKVFLETIDGKTTYSPYSNDFWRMVISRPDVRV